VIEHHSHGARYSDPWDDAIAQHGANKELILYVVHVGERRRAARAAPSHGT
jgi:hypothetical protein